MTLIVETSCRCFATVVVLALLPACASPDLRKPTLEGLQCEPSPPTAAVSILLELPLEQVGILSTNGMSVDPLGGVWVLDQSGPVVARFDRNGKPRAVITAKGPAPWELGAPQAIAADRRGGVWVADAKPPRLIRFDSAGNHVETLDSRAAMAAVSVAAAEDRVLLSQRIYSAPRNATVPPDWRRHFVRGVELTNEVRDIDADEVDGDRFREPPFYGAPMIEAVVAAREDGAFVVTYSQAYRLRWFDAGGSLLREIQGCQGRNDNSKTLAQSSIETGMRYAVFGTAMAFGPNGHLVHLAMTSDNGYHRLDVFDGSGNPVESALLPSKSRGGIAMATALPTPDSRQFWSYSFLDGRAYLIRLDWNPHGGTANE